MMEHFALIGGSLSHSYSKHYFDSKFQSEGLSDCTYSMCEMPTLQGLRMWVEEGGIKGFNVTFPHKQAIIPHLDRLDPEAAAIGAVNCVAVEPGGRLVGYNTDAPAFRQTLQPLLPFGASRALVLGRGGAARAACHVLRTMGMECLTTDRHLNLYEPDCRTPVSTCTANKVPFDLLVNATPVGTFPNVEATPWPWPERLHRGMVVYDMVYNPDPTRLMSEASLRGCTVRGGLAMLYRQAELSWQLWRSS